MVRRGWVAAVGFLCHLIAAIGLFGLAFNPRMVELAFILIIITLMPAIAWLFLRFPEYFEDKDL
jgi:putative exporter of polyketide antibiotics